MPVFTVQSLINRAAALADMHDQFVRPDQWVSWYNTERRSLQLFMARYGAAMQDLNFQTVVGPDVVTISGDTLALVGVWEQRDRGMFRQLQISDFPGNFFQLAGGTATGPAQYVSIEDTNSESASNTVLRFYPRDTTGTYIIVTAKAPPEAADAAATVSLPMGIEEWIVVRMARRALVKEESDTREIEKMILEQNQIVEGFVASRSMAQGMKVRNTDYVTRTGWSHEMLYPEVSGWVWI